MNTYKQGHDKHSTATHERRTPESDAAFLLPYIKDSDHILDVGCGPGTITAAFTRYATKGSVIGVDLSAEVLEKARHLAAGAASGTSEKGSVSFQQANVLERLPFEDDTFDIVFASQVLGHIPLPELPVRALAEMRRVLKPGGLLATRDAVESNAYPRRLGLDKLFFQKQWLVLQNRKIGDACVASEMPQLCRRAGFEIDGDGFQISGGSTVIHSPAERQWMASRMAGMLAKGSTTYQNWRNAGIEEAAIQEAVDAIQTWADTEGAWHLAVQCEILARK